MPLSLQKMRDLRNERRYSLRRLAAESGVSLGHICDIENGKVNPSVATIERLAAALDVPVTALFDGGTPEADEANKTGTD